MKPRTAAFDTLLGTVSAEHDVVEYLLFKLVTLKLLLLADEGRFVDKATGEVEKLIDGLRQAEQVRDEALRSVAAEWDVPLSELTLERLALESSGDDTTTIRTLQRSLRGLADEIETVLDDNRRLASNGLVNLRTVLDTVTETTGTQLYTEAGQRHRTLVRPVQLDRSL